MRNYWRWSLLGSLLFIFVLVGCGGETATTNPVTTTPTTTTSNTHQTKISNMQGGLKATPTKSAITTATDPMTDSLRNLNGKDFETNFMQEMIAHHQSAIEMANMVATHTKRPELNALAQTIITTQTQEIKNMTAWLNQWDNKKPLADSSQVPGMMDMMSSMDKLKTAKNADFDKQFNALMIQHHQQGINMARLIPAKTQRPELIKLGEDIIQAQSAEIQQMKSWQKAWFNA